MFKNFFKEYKNIIKIEILRFLGCTAFAFAVWMVASFVILK